MCLTLYQERGQHFFLIHTVELVHKYYAEEIFVLLIHRFGIDQFLEVMSLSIIYSVKSEPREFFFGISGRYFLYRFEMCGKLGDKAVARYFLLKQK